MAKVLQFGGDTVLSVRRIRFELVIVEEVIVGHGHRQNGVVWFASIAAFTQRQSVPHLSRSSQAIGNPMVCRNFPYKEACHKGWHLWRQKIKSFWALVKHLPPTENFLRNLHNHNFKPARVNLICLARSGRDGYALVKSRTFSLKYRY